MVLFCHITTKIPGHKYDGLLSEKGGGGFPYLAFLNAEGDVVAKHQGPRSIEGFQQTAKDAKLYVELKKKMDEGKADLATKVDFLVVSAKLGNVSLADAQKQAKDLAGLSPDQQKKVDEALANLEIADILKTVRSKDAQAEAGRKFFEMKKEGRVATFDGTIWGYWVCILTHAEAQKDAATYEEGLNALKAKFKDSAAYKKALEQFEKTLQSLKQ